MSSPNPILSLFRENIQRLNSKNSCENLLYGPGHCIVSFTSAAPRSSFKTSPWPWTQHYSSGSIALTLSSVRSSHHSDMTALFTGWPLVGLWRPSTLPLAQFIQKKKQNPTFELGRPSGLFTVSRAWVTVTSWSDEVWKLCFWSWSGALIFWSQMRRSFPASLHCGIYEATTRNEVFVSIKTIKTVSQALSRIKKTPTISAINTY